MYAWSKRRRVAWYSCCSRSATAGEQTGSWPPVGLRLESENSVGNPKAAPTTGHASFVVTYNKPKRKHHDKVRKWAYSQNRTKSKPSRANTILCRSQGLTWWPSMLKSCSFNLRPVAWENNMNRSMNLSSVRGGDRIEPIDCCCCSGICGGSGGGRSVALGGNSITCTGMSGNIVALGPTGRQDKEIQVL